MGDIGPVRARFDVLPAPASELERELLRLERDSAPAEPARRDEPVR